MRELGRHDAAGRTSPAPAPRRGSPTRVPRTSVSRWRASWSPGCRWDRSPFGHRHGLVRLRIGCHVFEFRRTGEVPPYGRRRGRPPGRGRLGGEATRDRDLRRRSRGVPHRVGRLLRLVTRSAALRRVCVRRSSTSPAWRYRVQRRVTRASPADRRRAPRPTRSGTAGAKRSVARRRCAPTAGAEEAAGAAALAKPACFGFSKSSTATRPSTSTAAGSSIDGRHRVAEAVVRPPPAGGRRSRPRRSNAGEPLGREPRVDEHRDGCRAEHRADLAGGVVDARHRRRPAGSAGCGSRWRRVGRPDEGVADAEQRPSGAAIAPRSTTSGVISCESHSSAATRQAKPKPVISARVHPVGELADRAGQHDRHDRHRDQQQRRPRSGSARGPPGPRA